MKTEPLFENPIMRVVKRIKNIGGKPVARTVIEMPPAVMVIAIDKGNMVRFLGEYMASTGQHENTFAKGRIDEGETAYEAAERELAEELGLKGDLEHLLTVANQPSHSTAVTHIYVARNCRSIEQATGDEEDGTLYPKAMYYPNLVQQPEAVFSCVRCLAAMQALRIRDLERQLGL